MNLDDNDIDRLSVSPAPQEEPANLDSLPAELLAIIFVLARPKNRFPHTLPFEVVLSHISSRLRAVALTTPALWTRIDIYSPRSVEWACAYQRRSAPMPLDVRIDVYRRDKYKSRASSTAGVLVLVQLVANTLLVELHRMRSLFIFAFNERTLLAILSQLVNHSAPILERLTVKYDRMLPTAEPRYGGIRVLKGGMPLLTFLDTDLPDCLPPLSSQNLTTLHLHSLTAVLNLTYISFLQIITAPPSLENLSIQGCMNLATWHTHFTHTKFVLKELRSLRLLDDGTMAIKMLLSMSAPKLESLWLDCSFDSFSTFFDAPQMAGPTKFPALQYLTIPSYAFHQHNRFPKAFPTIKHLHLPFANFFNATRLNEMVGAQWPHLHTLAVSMIRETHITKFNGAMNAVLASRRAVGHPLRHLLVDEDLMRLMKKLTPSLAGKVAIKPLGLDNYKEHWWVASQEEHMDRL
ncbi:hypothetical protein B0H34DRAFT_374747 [Crassisporium funariophilum]|nr:hypothetical protein B0H34DRAFT_374747 [Crassisporium funariophilum]